MTLATWYRRWRDERRKPVLKCIRLGHDLCEQHPHRVYLTQWKAKELGLKVWGFGLVAIAAIKSYRFCVRCRHQENVQYAHLLGIHSLSLPGDMFDELRAEGEVSTLN